MFIGERLKEERKRLGLNQTQFAGVAGVQISAQTNYETGKRSPDAAYLAALAAAGVDVLYVLTGQRGGAVADALTPRERAMLGNYRGLSPTAQDAAQTVLGALAQSPAVKKGKAA